MVDIDAPLPLLEPTDDDTPLRPASARIDDQEDATWFVEEVAGNDGSSRTPLLPVSACLDHQLELSEKSTPLPACACIDDVLPLLACSSSQDTPRAAAAVAPAAAERSSRRAASATCTRT